MAEVATLARHLLMPEVLQICESVHKKVEKQKLMVYQQGDVHTVVADQTISSRPVDPVESTAYVVAMQSNGQAVLTHTGQPEAGEAITVITGEDATAESLALLAGATVDGEMMTVVTHSGQAGSAESLAIMAHSDQAEAGETMTVVTHSGQAGSSESLAVVQAWTVEEPQVEDTSVTESMQSGPFLISVDPDKGVPTEKVDLGAVTTALVVQEESLPKPMEASPQPAPPPVPTPQKRRPGRPPKVKQVPPPEPDPIELEAAESGSAGAEEKKDDQEGFDPNKRNLRKRLMREGGYVRLHMGIENEEEEKTSNTVKVYM